MPQVVTDPAEADFILAHGTEAVGLPDGSTSDRSLQQLQQLIQQCADVAQQQGRQLPMIVANPDLVSTRGNVSFGDLTRRVNVTAVSC